MADDEKVWNLSGLKIFEASFTVQNVDPEFYEQITKPKIPMTVSTSMPAPGEPDMDWTEPCLERGTMMHVDGAVNADVPVQRAWVKDEVLHFEGTVYV